MSAWWPWQRKPRTAFTAPVPWIDFHCHIVPGVDDGPRTLDEAVAMVEAAARIGITHIVTTPHYSDRYAPSEELVARALANLRNRLSGAAAVIQIIVGREVTLTDQHIQNVQQQSFLRIGGLALALVELPEGLNRAAIVEGCSALLAAGTRPVIAHPERNFLIQDAPELVAELRLRGAVVQVNAGSINGAYGIAAQRTAKQLLQHQLADVLSSDAHDARDIESYLKACQTITREMGAAQVIEMTSTTPARLLRIP